MVRPERLSLSSSIALEAAAKVALPPPSTPPSTPIAPLAIKGDCDERQWDQLLRLNQFVGVGRAIPISRSSWWKGVKEGRYPKPVKLGPRTTAWRLSDIQPLIHRGVQAIGKNTEGGVASTSSDAQPTSRPPCEKRAQ